ncbi:hypothetical protein HID58_093057 [Brassica napus]|uniref:Secreted protein n=1 Tax=Brassica napus TaxID=3708 RepID=A0ABQ7XCC0_BRANA|nr:hypothetical protein HID58_093057 [Brassica napus]
MNGGVERCRGFEKGVSFLLLFLCVFSPSLNERRWRFERRFFRLGASRRRNGDGSIGGCRRRRETETFPSVAVIDQRKRRPLALRPRKTPTSRSIGGSLRRVTTASLAAEVNRKGGVMKRPSEVDGVLV